MKYITQKDPKHTLLLANDAPFSIFFGSRRMRSVGIQVKVLTSHQILPEPLPAITIHFEDRTRKSQKTPMRKPAPE